MAIRGIRPLTEEGREWILSLGNLPRSDTKKKVDRAAAEVFNGTRYRSDSDKPRII